MQSIRKNYVWGTRGVLNLLGWVSEYMASFRRTWFYELRLRESVWMTEMNMRLIDLKFLCCFYGKLDSWDFEWILIDFKTFWFYKSELPHCILSRSWCLNMPQSCAPFLEVVLHSFNRIVYILIYNYLLFASLLS